MNTRITRSKSLALGLLLLASIPIDPLQAPRLSAAPQALFITPFLAASYCCASRPTNSAVLTISFTTPMP